MTTRTYRLDGHHRTLAQAAPGLWEASCLCDWSAMRPTKRSAEKAYRAHVGNLMPSCSVCGQVKHPREMSKARATLCKSCATAKARAWKAANPEAWDRHARKSHLMKQYGLTPERFDAMLADQGGGCAVCRAPVADARGYRPHVDHCHDSGRVRGLLCGRCNRSIGMMGDDPQLLRDAAAYLERTT